MGVWGPSGGGVRYAHRSQVAVMYPLGEGISDEVNI